MKAYTLMIAALAVVASAQKKPCGVTALKACSGTTAPRHNTCLCRAQLLDDAAQFKCAVMYEDVPKKNGKGVRDLTWLGALPDALRRPSIRDSTDPELKASFGGIEAKSFWWRKSQPDYEEKKCNAVHASAKCYAAMIDPTEKDLDECAVNIINEKGKQTFGDSLCQNLMDANLITGKNINKITNINVGMYYSYCGNDWEAVANGNVPLRLKEPLCCKADPSDSKSFKFYRCDGSDFNTSDSC